MPRTNGVYTPPAGTKAAPNTTIRSAPYNALVDDLAADANEARPITAGGTGATNATDARENLGALASADVLNALLKDSPVDADGLVVTDSEDSGKLKRVLWTKVKALINTGSVGAAVADASDKETPDDGDFLAGVQAGGSTMFKTTWANMKAALAVIFYNKTEVNNIVAGNMNGRAYPRRADGVAMNFSWSGQGGQPIWLWGANEPGTDIRVYNPSNFNVASVGGWNQATIANQINARVSDARYAGNLEMDLAAVPNNQWNSYSGYVMVGVWIRTGNGTLNNLVIMLKQPQIYIPNTGWRALGGW